MNVVNETPFARAMDDWGQATTAVLNEAHELIVRGVMSDEVLGAELNLPTDAVAHRLIEVIGDPDVDPDAREATTALNVVGLRILADLLTTVAEHFDEEGDER